MSTNTLMSNVATLIRRMSGMLISTGTVLT